MHRTRRCTASRAALVAAVLALLGLVACGDTGPSDGDARAPEVGARAPQVPELPPGSAIVVFYRGHW